MGFPPLIYNKQIEEESISESSNIRLYTFDQLIEQSVNYYI